MNNNTVKIGGYDVTQLSESEFELANPDETLDFYFDASKGDEIDVFVFDSLRPTKSKDDPFLTVFSTETLEEAVTDSMKFKKSDIVNLATNWD